jgi:hypothetical protein
MSVIGRLDKQVEEVIIKPVGRPPAGEDNGASAPRPAPQEPAEATRPGPREKRRGGRPGAAELPVWLL